MRNLFHYLCGFSFVYAIAILTDINEFPLTLEYWNNYLVFILFPFLGFFLGGVWEWFQSYTYGSYYDWQDVGRTAIGGLFGGCLTFFFVSQSLMIALIIASALLVIKDLRR